MTEKAEASALFRFANVIGRCMPGRNTPAIETNEDQNYREVRRALTQGSQVCFVSSYPRSGNTWLRFLLSDIFLQRAGMMTHTELPVPPGKVIPDLYYQLIADREPDITPGIFVKTHEHFSRLTKHVPMSPRRPCKHVYIFRTPEDALMSFYRYHLDDPNLNSKVGEGKDAFCRARIGEWASNAASYVRAAKAGTDVFFISYEDMLVGAVPILKSLMNWLGVDCTEAMLQRAVSNMHFDNMAKGSKCGDSTSPELVKKREGGEVETDFAMRLRGINSSGRGCPGAGVAELKTETVDSIHKDTDGILAELNQILVRQNRDGNRR